MPADGMTKKESQVDLAEVDCKRFLSELQLGLRKFKRKKDWTGWVSTRGASAKTLQKKKKWVR